MDIFWEKGQCTPHTVDSEKSKKLVQASGGCTETQERYGLLVVITITRIQSKNYKDLLICHKFWISLEACVKFFYDSDELWSFSGVTIVNYYIIELGEISIIFSSESPPLRTNCGDGFTN